MGEVRPATKIPRWLGPVVCLLGLGLLVVGLLDMMSSVREATVGAPERASLGWMVFLGLPLCMIGMLLAKKAFMAPAAEFLHRRGG